MLGGILRQHIVEFIPGTGMVTDGVINATSLSGPWTWVSPNGVARGLISGCGAGGGGAGGYGIGTALAGGGGGGGGVCCIGFPAFWYPGASLTITAGAPGPGGAVGAGAANGGATTCAGLATNIPGSRTIFPTPGTMMLAGGGSPNYGGTATGGGPGGGGYELSFGGDPPGAGGTNGAAPTDGLLSSEVFYQVFGAQFYERTGMGGGGACTTVTTPGATGGGWRSNGGEILNSSMTYANGSAGFSSGTISYGGGGDGAPSYFGAPGIGGGGAANAAGTAATGFGSGGGGGGGGGVGGNGAPGYLRIEYWSAD